MTVELGAEELEPLQRLELGGPANPVAPVTLGPAPTAAVSGAEPAPAPRRRKAAAPREAVAVPTDIKAIPRPRRIETSEIAIGEVLFDASRPSSVRASMQVESPRLGPPLVAAPEGGLARVNLPPPRANGRGARATPPTPAWASWLVVVAALSVGLLIVAAGFWYRASARLAAEQRLRLQAIESAAESSTSGPSAP